MTNEIETPKRTRKIAVVGTTTVGAITQTGRISMSAPCIKEVDKVTRVRKPKYEAAAKLDEAYSAEELSAAQRTATGRTKTAPATNYYSDFREPGGCVNVHQPKLAPNGIVLDENNCHILPTGDCIGGVTAGADPCICDLFPKSPPENTAVHGNRSLRVVDVVFGLESPASGVVTVVLKDDRYDLTEAQLQHCDLRTKGRLASSVRAIIAHNLKKVPGVTFNVKWDGK